MEQKQQSLTERGPTTGTGQNRIGGNFVSTGRTIKPVPAETTLLLRKPLLLFALRATAIHLAVFQIIFEKKTAARAFGAPRFMDNRFTARNRALENSFTVTAPVVTF